MKQMHNLSTGKTSVNNSKYLLQLFERLLGRRFLQFAEEKIKHVQISADSNAPTPFLLSMIPILGNAQKQNGCSSTCHPYEKKGTDRQDVAFTGKTYRVTSILELSHAQYSAVVY